MGISKAELILVIFLTMLATNVSSQPTSPTFKYTYCRTALFGNYTTNSTYETNLKTMLLELETQASLQPFYNTSAGSAPDTVHGQYYCRGDIGAPFCSRCIQEAAQKALNCSNAKAAVIWYDECTLRYNNQSVYGVSEDQLVLQSYWLSNLTRPEELSAVINDTVNGLIEEAVLGDASIPRYFATREVKLSVFDTAYFLVQCSPDLNNTQCGSCLVSAFLTMQTCCGQWPRSLYTFPPSCQVMYNTTALFYFSPNAAPAPPVSFQPPPPASITSESPPPFPSPSTINKSPPSPPSPPSEVTFLPSTPPPPTGGAPIIRNIDSLMIGISTITLLVFALLFNI